MIGTAVPELRTDTEDKRMNRLYSYTLKLPLTYCAYDLRSDDGEFVLGLANAVEWDEPCPVDVPYPLDEAKRYKATENMHFCVSSRFAENVSDDGKRSYQMPDNYFICIISGIIGENKKKARELVDACIIKACKTLSILMSINNCNKQGYQPRVEPDYSKQEWLTEEYGPYERLVVSACQPQEYIDADGNRVICMYADAGAIEIGGSVHCTIFGKMDTAHFFDYYKYETSPDLSYIIDEYYAALGRESITSKFFHLFAIIEYIEKRFSHLADTCKVFDEKDKQQILENIEQINMPKEKHERLRSMVMDAMGKATELGREAKLVNILHNMGIKEFTDCGTQFVINKQSIKELTVLRNSFFHGDGKKVEGTNSHISVEVAVARLMYICEKVIVYVAGTK